MGSSRPTERSLGEATFLPQWMKDKLDTRFDYSDSSFSPPADDTFFYIRYPNYRRETVASAASNSKESLRAINEVLNNKSESGNRLINQSENSNYKNVNNIDFSKHPLPCQSFIPFIAENVKEPKIIVANKGKIKYQTTDDDFCDPKTSECGRSIVHVANQIMSSTSSKSNSSDSSCTTQNKSDSNLEQQQYQRKVSKSLPATPLTSPNVTPDNSPKLRRRVYGNRFFTGAFVPDNGEQRQKNGWLLSSILGQSRELITPKIEEEDEQSNSEQIPPRALSRKKSISSQNLTYVGKDEKQPSSQSTQNPIHINVLQPKPSELREMNFWSPTSM